MNSVNVTGFLKEGIDEYHRNFLYDIPFMIEGNEKLPEIIVKFWTTQANSRLIMLANNTRVAIHGHLDADEKFGTILLVEQLEVIR